MPGREAMESLVWHQWLPDYPDSSHVNSLVLGDMDGRWGVQPREKFPEIFKIGSSYQPQWHCKISEEARE